MGSADDITSLVIGGGVVGAIRLAKGASVVGDVVGLAETENESSNEFGGRVGGDIGLAEGANVIGDAVGLSKSSADVIGGGVGGGTELADGADVMGDVVGLVESGADVMGDAVGLVESGANVVGDREMHKLNRTHALTPHAISQSPSIVYVISRTGGQYHNHWSTHGAGLGGAVCCFVTRGGGGQKKRMRSQRIVIVEPYREHAIISVIIQIAPCIQLTACTRMDDGACTRSTSPTTLANRGIFVCVNFVRRGGGADCRMMTVIATLLQVDLSVCAVRTRQQHVSRVLSLRLSFSFNRCPTNK